MSTTNPSAPINPTSIRFTRKAYSKLEFIRDIGPTEVGGFGISSEHDPLLITDFVMVKQEATAAFVEFCPADLNAHMNRMCDAGIMPNRSIRVWIHTHPGNSAHPSSVDEKCFAEEFANPDWAVMFIWARGGATYCRLKVNNGKMCLTRDLAVQVVDDNEHHAEWKAEYDANWKEKKYTTHYSFPAQTQTQVQETGRVNWWEQEKMKREAGAKPIHSVFQVERPLLPKTIGLLTKQEAQQYITWAAGNLTQEECRVIAADLLAAEKIHVHGKAKRRVDAAIASAPEKKEESNAANLPEPAELTPEEQEMWEAFRSEM